MSQQEPSVRGICREPAARTEVRPAPAGRRLPWDSITFSPTAATYVWARRRSRGHPEITPPVRRSRARLRTAHGPPTARERAPTFESCQGENKGHAHEEEGGGSDRHLPSLRHKPQSECPHVYDRSDREGQSRLRHSRYRFHTATKPNGSPNSNHAEGQWQVARSQNGD